VKAASDTRDIEAFCATLVQRALDTGAPDNVTVVAARFISDKTDSDKPAA
jgi:serine/threonine protein phosphatase PrpC